MNSLKVLVLSRLPCLPFNATYFLVKSLRLFPGFYRRAVRPIAEKSCLAIEAGIQGWAAIEFKELERSSKEYFGANGFTKVVIDKTQPYVPQVEDVLRDSLVTHYLYDPRTGRQNFSSALSESIQVAVLMARYRVVPVVFSTDLSVRVWRCQAATVSAVSGAVVTFMMPRKVQPIFPHRRLIGPSLMPFSIETLEHLEAVRIELSGTNSVQNLVRFTGTLYEPRTTFLQSFKADLIKTGCRVEILGREMGSSRVPDDEYWFRLGSAAIVITTAEQMIQSGTDFSSIPHLVYRYLEVLAAGSLLLAPRVPGVTRYFEPEIHFVEYDSLEEAVSKAIYFLDHPKESEAIRIAGHEKAAYLIRSHSFWVQVDTALGSESFTL
jgi:hypothetical protein